MTLVTKEQARSLVNQKLNPSTISINPLDLNSILNSIIDIIGTGGDGNGLYGGDGDINNGTIATLLGNLTITSTVINPALDFDSTFISVEGTIASWNTVSGKKVFTTGTRTLGTNYRIITANTERLRIDDSGRFGFGVGGTIDNTVCYNFEGDVACSKISKFISSTSTVAMEIFKSGVINTPNYPVHLDEAAAVLAGLNSGDHYKTPTGELRIKL